MEMVFELSLLLHRIRAGTPCIKSFSHERLEEVGAAPQAPSLGMLDNIRPPARREIIPMR